MTPRRPDYRLDASFEWEDAYQAAQVGDDEDNDAVDERELGESGA